MRLTRRGRLVALGVVVTMGWGAIFGVPVLNAVVIPGAIALIAGWILVARADPPSVERTSVEPGTPYESRRVAFSVSAPSSMRIRVADTFPADTRPRSGAHPLLVEDGEVAYEALAERRGVRRLGPVNVRIADPLGLVEHGYEIDETVELVTYPVMRELAWHAGERLLQSEGAPTRERHAFDRLREYEPGDPLRDIHWRSSAKRGTHEFTVKEFVAETDDAAVRIAAESPPEHADEMASAAASVAMWLLEAGIPIGLTLPDEQLPVAAGAPHRHRILRALARTDGGRLDADRRRAASIHIHATGEEGTVTVAGAGETVAFDRMTNRGRAQRVGGVA